MKFLTTKAQVKCIHGGTVQLKPLGLNLKSNGNGVLCMEDIIGAPISGCTQNVPAAGIIPCTAVVSVMAGFVPFVKVGGKMPLMQPMVGMTNGVPPGTIMAMDDGQSAVGLGMSVPLPTIPTPIPPEKQYKKEKKKWWKRKVWVEFELVDQDDKSVPNEWYRIEFSDGKVLDGILDGKGNMRLETIPKGSCKISFPNFDEEAVDLG